MSNVDLHLLMKHSMSTLPDLAVQVEIDRPGRLVTLGADSVDSALLLDLIFHILPKEHDVVAFSDDSAGWTPPAPSFGLRIRFDGRYLPAHASRLVTGTLTLRLETATVERMRMALDSAPRVLKAFMRPDSRPSSAGRSGAARRDTRTRTWTFSFTGLSSPRPRMLRRRGGS